MLDNVILKTNAAEDKEFYKEISDFLINTLSIVPTRKEGYRYIIGESKYPNQNNVLFPLPTSIYNQTNIGEIAFLSSSYTLDMFVICGILFNSLDKAAKFLEWLIPQGTKRLAQFGEYLFDNCNLLIFNRYDKQGKRYTNRDKVIYNLMNKYPPVKILVVGSRTTKAFDNMVNGLECKIIHSCAQNALLRASDWCETYFCKKDKSVTLIHLGDFAI